MKPLISIVTVTFNAAGLLEPTLKSVEEQTFGDYEHIIVDGQSTDGTLTLLSKHPDPRRRIYSRPDSGIYHGMNRGLKSAQGKYIIFLNAGDRFANPSTLQRYANEAMKDADIIYGDTDIINSDGTVIGKRHLDAPPILTYKSYLKGMLICHQAFMVKRELAPKYNRDYRLSADYDWCLECIANSRVTRRKNLKTETIHYLEGGMSQKKKLASLGERFVIMKRRFGLLPALRAHLSFIPRALKRKLGKSSPAKT